jgi:rubrerythrin
MDIATDHTLQVAEELERLGKTFYESFAAVCDNSRIAALAASLANAEKQHISLFRQMRETLPLHLRGRQLTGEELDAAAQELFGAIIPDAGTVRMAVMASGLRTALDMAIALEIRAAACYATIAAGMAGGEHTGALALLVEEEKEHCAILTEDRQRLFPLIGRAV